MDDSEGVIVLIASSMIVLVAVILALIGMMIVYQKRKSQHQRQLLQAKAEVLRNVSWEIHDNLGPKASLIKINLHSLELENPANARQLVEDTQEMTRALISDLKSLSLSFNMDWVARVGIEKAFENEVERLRKSRKFDARLAVAGVIPKFDADISIFLYRMGQEIIHNTIKHSQATMVSIDMNGDRNLLTLVFNDNGIGFDIEQKWNNSSSGLMNLQNRASLIGAGFSIQSKAGVGTTVTISLPLANHVHAADN